MFNLKFKQIMFSRITLLLFNFKHMSCIIILYRDHLYLHVLQPPSSLSSHGEILGYQITYREVTSGNPEVRTVRGRQKQEIALTGLRYYTRYEVAVRAFNQVGPGPASTPQLATTMEGGR